MTTSGDTQALPRIPVPGSLAGPLPTVALTIAVAAPQATPEPTAPGEKATEKTAERAGAKAGEKAAEVPVAVVVASPTPAAESHDSIYEEAMATIAALASSWSSAVQQTSGRHRAAA